MVAAVTARARASAGQAAPAPPRNRAPEPPPPQPRAEPASRQGLRPAETRRPEDIVTYWSRLRDNRRFPSTADLDSDRISSDWPNSILIRCRPGSRVLEAQRVFSVPDGLGSSLSGLRGSARVSLSPMMLQWLLGLAGEVVREGRPMTDDETFPTLNRMIRYHAVALPFSEDQRSVDHILCHVTTAS
ncbi:MAG: hypothetical protein ACE5GS_10430 [Kiloniellaceae bacterium]